MAQQTRLAALLLSTLASGGAFAQPVAPAARTGGLYVGDQTLDAVYLTRDLDMNGDADGPGEAAVYIDNSNAFGPVTGSVVGIFQSASGFVYIADADSDAVYRTRDGNADGDANDAGEIGVWFSSANASGFTLPNPNGLWEPEPGVVYIYNAGTTPEPVDAIYRTEDLNADGDANDAGEATVWADLAVLYPVSSGFELAFAGGAAYLADLRGGDPDAIIRMEDEDGSGSIDSNEWTTFLDVNNPYGAPIGLVAETDGQSIYVADNLSSSNQTIYRLTDLDGSGVIDSPAEAVLVWEESLLPAGSALGSIFTVALGPDGTLAVGSSGSDDEDAVFLLTDGDGDGLYLTPGETTVWRGDNGGSGALASRVRALEFAIGQSCPADVNGDGSVDSGDFFEFIADFIAGDADFNGDTVTDSGDFFEFIAAFFGGC